MLCTSPKLQIVYSAAIIVALGTLLAGCQPSEQEKQKIQAEADANQSLVSSCSANDMVNQKWNYLALAEQSRLCLMMQSTIGRLPTVALLRRLSQMILVMQVADDSTDAQNIGYQVMNIVEARGAQNNNVAIEATFETVTKIFNGTQGHVKPRDLNIRLRMIGQRAQKMTEDDIFLLAALIQQEKKAQGN